MRCLPIFAACALGVVASVKSSVTVYELGFINQKRFDVGIETEKRRRSITGPESELDIPGKGRQRPSGKMVDMKDTKEASAVWVMAQCYAFLSLKLYLI